MMTPGLRSLAHAIELFRGLDDDIPARVIHTFIVIASWDDGMDGRLGPTKADLVTQLGLQKSAVTRHVAALTKTHRLGKPGLDLVAEHTDATDPRKHRVRLTDRGRTLRARLIKVMGE